MHSFKLILLEKQGALICKVGGAVTQYLISTNWCKWGKKLSFQASELYQLAPFYWREQTAETKLFIKIIFDKIVSLPTNLPQGLTLEEFISYS
jgi:hypothetical protein